MRIECPYCHKMRTKSNMPRHYRSCKAKKEADRIAKEEADQKSLEEQDIRIQLAVLKNELKNEREKREKSEELRKQSEELHKQAEELCEKERELRIEAEKELAVKSRELVLKNQQENRNLNVMLKIFCNNVRPMAWKESDPGWNKAIAYLRKRMLNGIPVPRTPEGIVMKVDSNFERICYDEDSDQLLFIITDKSRGHARYMNMEGKQCDDAGCASIAETLIGVRYRAIRETAESIPGFSYHDQRYISGQIGKICAGPKLKRMMRQIKKNSYNYLNQFKETKLKQLEDTKEPDNNSTVLSII